jgi:hypothetical protein
MVKFTNQRWISEYNEETTQSSPFPTLADGTLQLMLIAHNLFLLVQILRIIL